MKWGKIYDTPVDENTWKKWFCWFPVRLIDGRFCWLECIERHGQFEFDEVYYTYRAGEK